MDNTPLEIGAVGYYPMHRIIAPLNDFDILKIQSNRIWRNKLLNVQILTCYREIERERSRERELLIKFLVCFCFLIDYSCRCCCCVNSVCEWSYGHLILSCYVHLNTRVRTLKRRLRLILRLPHYRCKRAMLLARRCYSNSWWPGRNVLFFSFPFLILSPFVVLYNIIQQSSTDVR